MKEEELKLVYWEVNGERRIAKINLSDLAECEVIYIHEGKQSPLGRWKYYGLKTPSGEKYVKREWIPTPGYNWDEIEVYAVPEK
ncbi:MAG: hypothetical protein QXJ59_06965 [Thermofilaceae archaeon]